MTTDKDQPTKLDWQAKFETNDTPWERTKTHPALEHWAKLGYLETGLHVYIPGCGRSLDPLVLAQMGLRVTISDIAPSAITYQEQRFSKQKLDVQAVLTDSLNWRPALVFDRLYEQTFLCAIPPAFRVDYENMAYESLKSGGILLALFMQKNERGGPPYGCNLDAMKELFKSSRWSWVESGDFLRSTHPNLDNVYEMAVTLKRL